MPVVQIHVVTRSTRAVRGRFRSPTSFMRNKLTYVVEIPTELNVGRFLKPGNLAGKQSCASQSLPVRIFRDCLCLCTVLLYPLNNHWAP